MRGARLLGAGLALLAGALSAPACSSSGGHHGASGDGGGSDAAASSSGGKDGSASDDSGEGDDSGTDASSGGGSGGASSGASSGTTSSSGGASSGGGSGGASGGGASSGSGSGGASGGASSGSSGATDASTDGAPVGEGGLEGGAQMPILATAIGVGEQSACAVVRGGTVACWGDDTYGELGIGSSAGLPTCESGACSTVAVAVPGLTHVAAVSVGEATACALLESGAVECWGDNTYGELGNGSATGPGTCGSEATPCAMSPVSTGVSEAIAISVGTESACALIYGGTVECWGDNSLGELGTGSTSGPETCGGNSCSTTPVAVPGITSAIAISVGSGAACALLQNGTVQCWGLDAYGELGNGQAGAITPEPVTVSGLTGATGISVNIVGGACALVSSATAECWGNGYPTLTPSADVTGLSNATAVAGFCALVYGGGVSCWPSVAGDDAGLPATAVTSISTATSVSAVTSQDTCALLSSGDVVCWGYNAFGQLGDGTTDDSTTPVTVVQ